MTDHAAGCLLAPDHAGPCVSEVPKWTYAVTYPSVFGPVEMTCGIDPAPGPDQVGMFIRRP